MTKLSGFPEFLPAERAVEQHVLDHLRRVFELHGFANIETRAVETLETLLRKGEIDKEVYAIRRLQADDDEAAELALHYDLTVPFARYVLENSNELDFPFRRWQIQKVWRGERPQQGRFREFTQADIDIVGRGSLPFQADVEVAQVMAEALSGLPIPALTLQVSNRKVLEGFALGLGIVEPTAVMPVVDKLDKLPRERVLADLQGVGLSESQADAILDLAAISGGGADVARACARSVSPIRCWTRGSRSLPPSSTVSRRTERGHGRRRPAHRPRPRLLHRHGLRDPHGRLRAPRFDLLRWPLRPARRRPAQHVPRRGISLGVSRLLVPLIADGLIASRAVPSVVLVSLADEDSRAEAADVARRLRARGIATEVAPKPEKFGKQIQHAEKRGIPFVWFPATACDGSVKDIRSGEQLPADPDHWDPPPADLTPQIHPVTKENRLDSLARRRQPDCRQRRRNRHPRRLGRASSRPRRSGVHRPAGGLRRRPGCRPRGSRASTARRVLPEDRRQGRASPGGQREPGHPHRRDRGHRRRRRDPVVGRAAALPDRRARRGRRGGAAEVPLPRPAPAGPRRSAAVAVAGQQGRPRRARCA